SEKEPQAEGSSASSDSYYLSVAFEQGIPGAHPSTYMSKLAAEKAKYTFSKILLITLLCGLIGGLLSVPVVFLQGNNTKIMILLLVVFGPF
ncbi:hypothetical protein B0D78_12325, partial [Pyramidobacter sp. C12-8]